jgi:glycosyltransferase involved in cell wall biosynthesis
MKVLCLLWGPFGSRLDELAEVFNGKRVSLTLFYGPRYLAPLRYLALFLRTLILLSRESPDIVFAQNPPIFCPLTCLLYCRIARRRLFVDHHSVWTLKTIGGGPIGLVIRTLESVVSASANANTVPHSFWARELASLGAREVSIIHDFVPRNPFKKDERVRERYAAGKTFVIAAHGGHPLEGLEVEVKAAAGVKALMLVISGPPEKLSKRLSHTNLPENVKYVGFLPRSEYDRLKASSDFAVNITQEPNTLSHVLLEFAASSLPIISSRQPAVEEVFGDSILYVESSSPEEVQRKMRLFVDRPDLLASYRRKIDETYTRLALLRDVELNALRQLAGASSLPVSA